MLWYCHAKSKRNKGINHDFGKELNLKWGHITRVSGDLESTILSHVLVMMDGVQIGSWIY
jgi:hypothetical protein